LPKLIFITSVMEGTMMVEEAEIVVITPNVVLKNVLYSPKFTYNLISIR